MTFRLPLSLGQKFTTLVSCYAPTMTNPDEVKNKFYEDSNTIITTVPDADKLIVLGDFNARVGCDSSTWEGVIGKHETGSWKLQQQRSSTPPDLHRARPSDHEHHLPPPYTQQDSKRWHLIDYVIIRKRDRQDVRVTKAMCGAECWTDHRLIVSKLKIRVQPKRRSQGMKTPRRLNTSTLKVPNIKKSFVDTLAAHLQSTVTNDHDVEAAWAKFREMVYAIAMD